MKTAVIEGNRKDDGAVRAAWYFIADSALANAGKPFFLPDFADSFEAVLAPAIRISRLGKSVAAKFADRYFSEILPAVHFRAPALRRQLLERNLPCDMALSFDRSMIMGQPLDYEAFRAFLPLRLVNNGEAVAEWSLSDFSLSPEEALEAVSAANTVKTGDLIVPGLSKPVVVRQGDRLEIMLGETRQLLVAIK